MPERPTMDPSHVDRPASLPPSGLFGAPSPSSRPAARDRGAYAALLSMLEALGVFERVILGDEAQRDRAGAADFPLAVVMPRGWEESDDYDPTLLVRRVSFAILIVVKSEEGGAELDALDLLASAIQDVVDGSDLGGTCLAPLSKIESGRHGQATRHPERGVELVGSFTMLIDPLVPPTA